jgi:beta-phosphoglucomutase-like phosphatase (HAD superfamily)
VAVEDSSNGIRSAAGAGIAVIALPNRDFPPSADALALADQVLETLDRLTPELIRGIAATKPVSRPD